MNTPTSNEISIEQNGRRIGGAQFYSIATLTQKPGLLTLTCVCPLSDSTSRDWEDFTVIITRPNRKIIYSGCNWSIVRKERSIISEMVVAPSKRYEFE